MSIQHLKKSLPTMFDNFSKDKLRHMKGSIILPVVLASDSHIPKPILKYHIHKFWHELNTQRSTNPAFLYNIATVVFAQNEVHYIRVSSLCLTFLPVLSQGRQQFAYRANQACLLNSERLRKNLMNKTATERPLHDPRSGDSNGACMHVCVFNFSCSIKYTF